MGTGVELEDAFYEVLAGAGRAACLFAAVDLGLEALLAGGPRTEAEIVALLGLDRWRGHKWLALLTEVGLVEVAPGIGGPRYANGPLLAALADPSRSYFYREFMRYWRTAAMHEMSAVVRGAPVPDPVRYPPQREGDVALLHAWMREGALVTLAAIERRFEFAAVRRVLDVGGGDATMACALALRHPQLEPTVFNLPQAAALARANAAAQGLAGRVRVVEGDFFRDALPGGFELVMFSRVLADWPPEACAGLLRKGFAALASGGRLLLAEPFREQNPGLSIAWEHSYLPYDDFGARLYKTTASYAAMLIEAGFVEVAVLPRDEAAIHGVIVARRP